MFAEWNNHERTWICWPRREEIWLGGMTAAEASYEGLIRALSVHEPVRIILDPKTPQETAAHLGSIENTRLEFQSIDDSWIRDNGPTFYTSESSSGIEATIWHFNGWGQKYQPFDNDAQVAGKLCTKYEIPARRAPLVCEGGAINGNGRGTLLTTESVILNPNRNPRIGKGEATEILQDYTGCSTVLWLPAGLIGDETDGHVDNIACFVEDATVFAAYAPDRSDENFAQLKQNIALLGEMRNQAGRPLDVVPVPLPPPVIEQGGRLTASYINFYFVNGAIIVPVFEVETDDTVLAIFEDFFPDRRIVPFNARQLCIGGGGIHCVTLAEPSKDN